MTGVMFHALVGGVSGLCLALVVLFLSEGMPFWKRALATSLLVVGVALMSL